MVMFCEGGESFAASFNLIWFCSLWRTRDLGRGHIRPNPGFIVLIDPEAGHAPSRTIDFRRPRRTVVGSPAPETQGCEDRQWSTPQGLDIFPPLRPTRRRSTEGWHRTRLFVVTGGDTFNLASHFITLVVMFPATFCAGMTLPLITFTLLKQGGGEKSIGAVYAANTAGAIVGAIAANGCLPTLAAVSSSTTPGRFCRPTTHSTTSS